MKCRMCGGQNLVEFLDLGSTPPADEFKTEAQLREADVYYPLQVYMCDDCGLAQLGFVVSPEVLYRNDYPYESSTTAAGREHWTRFARSVVAQLGVSASELVVDIGSNVGVLLEAFQTQKMRVQGVDPAPGIAASAVERGIDTICDFFGPEIARRIVGAQGRASLITGTNVFAHVDDLASFMRGVDCLLADRGALIIEAPYFANLVAYTEYDTIYHEHLSYLSIRPLVPFFRRFDMEVFNVQQVEIHGGSFRVFVGRRGVHPVSPEVDRLLAQELETRLHAPETLQAFAHSVRQNRKDLLWLLHRLKNDGKSIAGVSAPAKGMTLLNYSRIGTEILDFVTEKAPLKIGRFTPGSHIPVRPDAELLRVQPDYALLLAWNFAEEIMRNLDEYRQKGGRFIIPIPTPRIVS
ncbi:MAG: methyltransferase [Gemmatimonadetes bacterium]|nr:MAG: methyltransferase [Gemmatimonadota bacterium]